MKESDFSRDPAAIEQGEWVENIPQFAGVRLKVRGRDNSDWRRLEATLMNAVPRGKMLSGVVDPGERDKITGACLLQAGLLDWDGFEDEKGLPMPYSKDQAAKWLMDPQFRAFRDAVLWATTVVGESAAVKKDAQGGN